MEQIPLRRVMQLDPPENDHYLVRLPPSVCFGNVCSGGLVMSIAARAASDLVSQSSGGAIPHRDVLHFTTRFFRPLFAEPQVADFRYQLKNTTKTLTTLSIEIFQRGKLCLAGYITLADFSVPSQITANTGWQLVPPPVTANLADLESDNDASWVSYLPPFSDTSFRNPQSYMKYHLPLQRHGPHMIDQWVTPGWADPTSGAVWTNDLVHFVVDNCLPLLNDLINSEGKPLLYDLVISAGHEQRAARQVGKDDRILGKDMAQESMIPWIISTVSVTTEVKKLLHPEGERWLFMRAIVKSLNNKRMDSEIILSDAQGNLVALSNQLAQIIPTASKMEKRSEKAAL